MSQLKTELPTDTWVVATWDDYIQATGDPVYEKARGYYYDGQLRIEFLLALTTHEITQLSSSPLTYLAQLKAFL